MFLFNVGHGEPAEVKKPRSRSAGAAEGANMARGVDENFDVDNRTRFAYLADATAERLPEGAAIVEALDMLGDAMIEQGNSDVDSATPPVYTYWSQFIDHELTAKTDRDVGTVSSIEGAPGDLNASDPAAVEAELMNRRTPAFELDAVYADGVPGVAYKKPRPKGLSDLAAKLRDGARMRIGQADPITGRTPPPNDANELARDLPRIGPLIDAGVLSEDEFDPDFAAADNFRTRAFIGDKRNDENLAVAQFHLSILRFHNAVVDWLEANETQDWANDDELFERARKVVRWTFQWLVNHDFLKRIANPLVVDQVLAARAPRYQALRDRFNEHVIPLEFSTGAYRFGHSMIRDSYDFNRNFGEGVGTSPLIPNASLELLFAFTGSASIPFPQPGGTPTLPSNWIIEWDRFTGDSPTGAGTSPSRLARKIDTRLAVPLGDLVKEPAGIFKNLAKRNLRRGYVLSIPTGQAMAAEMGVVPLSPLQIGLDVHTDVAAALDQGGFREKTPLWYYILREAELGGGEHLGPLGSVMVAETFVGVMVNDGHSYLANDANWHPGMPVPGASTQGIFDAGDQSTISDLLRFAGVMPADVGLVASGGTPSSDAA